MQKIIETITHVEWVLLGLLGITVVALIFALIAWRRASRALQLIKNKPAVEVQHEEPLQQEEHRPAVSLEIEAFKNEFEQVNLVLSNTGLLAARQINLTIEKPEQIFAAEGLSGGLESADVTASSAILPRLAVLDADNTLPINEIISGNTVELSAALTMAHGKICAFPVSLSWKDGNGASQQKQVMLTV